MSRFPPAPLEALLTAERQRPGPSTEALARVTSRIEGDLKALPDLLSVAPAGPSAASSGAGAGLFRSLVVFLAGALAGAGLMAGIRPASVPTGAPAPGLVQREEHQPPKQVDLLPPAPSPVPLPERPLAVEARPGARREAAPVPTRPTPRADEELAAERALLEMARTNLAKGRAAQALALLEPYPVQFPNGQLAEEFESLLIQAWVSTGRHSEARERAAQFKLRFPDSMLSISIDAALSQIAAP